MQGVVELLFELRFVQRVCASDAQDCFLRETLRCRYEHDARSVPADERDDPLS